MKADKPTRDLRELRRLGGSERGIVARGADGVEPIADPAELDRRLAELKRDRRNRWMGNVSVAVNVVVATAAIFSAGVACFQFRGTRSVADRDVPGRVLSW